MANNDFSPFGGSAASTSSVFTPADSGQHNFQSSGNSRSFNPSLLSAFGSFLGPVGSMIGSGLSYLLGKRGQQSQSKQLLANMSFNRAMQKDSQRFAREMFDATNQYNDPSAVISRLRKAGINPALYYSNGQVGGLAASTAPGSSASSSGYPVNPFSSDPGGQFSEASRSFAETALLRAETRKVNAEADIQESDASIRDQLNRGILDFQNVQIRLAGSSANLTDEQIKKIQPEIDRLRKECDLFSSQADEISARISNIDADTIGKLVDNMHKDNYWKSVVSNFRSQVAANYAHANLSYAQANEIITLLSLKAAGLEKDVILKSAMSLESYNRSEAFLANAVKARIEGKKLEFEFTEDKKYYPLERAFKLAGAIASGSTGALSILGRALGAM